MELDEAAGGSPGRQFRARSAVAPTALPPWAATTVKSARSTRRLFGTARLALAGSLSMLGGRRSQSMELMSAAASPCGWHLFAVHERYICLWLALLFSFHLPQDVNSPFLPRSVSLIHRGP